MNKILIPSLVFLLLSSLAGCSQQVKIPEATQAASPKLKKAVVQQSQQHIRQQQPRYKPRYQPRPVKKPIQKKIQHQVRNKPPVYKRKTKGNKYSQNELKMIGNKIFVNEAGGVKSKLVHWNKGENFAAMGIGHFTWYPASSRRHRFGNTFPGLLSYLEQHGENLPRWLKRAKRYGAPWNSRRELMRAKGSRQVTELENLLYRTKHLQAKYIIKRAQRAMPKLVKKTPYRLRGHVAGNLNAVANTPGGWYALVDYVNFKGEGLNRHGGYKGQNWGLLQVLENMQAAKPGAQALDHFASSALAVLTRRVQNSPRRRNEARWLNGWSKRVNTYRYPFS